MQSGGRMNKKQKILKSAKHEAGHAVIALVTGYEFDEIEILFDGNTLTVDVDMSQSGIQFLWT
jgi:Peptidase M50B-like